MPAWIHCCSFCDKCASIFVLESPCPLVIRNPLMQLHVSYKNPGFLKNIKLSIAHVFYAHARKKNTLNITAELLQLCLIFFMCVFFSMLLLYCLCCILSVRLLKLSAVNSWSCWLSSGALEGLCLFVLAVI